MKAWVLNEHNQLPELKDVKIEADSTKVTLTLKASSLNHRDVWITQGQYPGIKKGVILGSDGCGEFEGNSYIINPSLEWGDNSHFQSSGFRVLGMPDHGTFAQEIQVEQKYLYPKPDHMTVEEAAALPLAGLTAFRALFTKTKPVKGEKVLISGIGGGVALFAMQFALAAGYEVHVTSGSEKKIEKAKEMGASAGYIYNYPDWTKQLLSHIDGVDIVIDGAGGAGFNQLVKVCNPGGRICFYGGSAGKIDGLNPQIIFWRQLSIFGSTMGSDEDFKNMLDFVNQHKIVPVIDEIIPFENLTRGVEKMNEGKQFGKIVFRH